MKNLKSFLILIMLMLLLPHTCRAEDDLSAIPVQVNGDQVQYFEGEKKVIAQGNVVVTYKDIKLTCKKVTAFVDLKEATAEGECVLTQRGKTIKGEKIVYNFRDETGTITNGTVQDGVWYGAGKELSKVSKDEVDIKNGYLTTCDLEKPHYRIRSREVKIYLGKRVVARDVVFEVGGVPLLYLPVYSQPIYEKISKFSVVPGADKKWGAYLLSSYRYNMSSDVKGNLYLDYRQKKGVGEGADVNMSTKDFGTGNLRVYNIYEHDKGSDTDTDRYRVQYRHEWQVLPDTTGIVDYNKMKDSNVTKDYFYRQEYEKDPQPGSYVSVIQAKPNFAVSFLARKRVNDFFTDVERLPELDVNIKNQRLTDSLPFYYKGDFNVANLDKVAADSDQINNVIRTDTLNEISMPFRAANFLSVDPYVGTRQTFYKREIDTDKEQFRGALLSGVDVSTNFYKTYDYKSDFLNMDINGVRHIFTPNLSYFYVSKPTVSPDKLFNFDDTDTLDRSTGFALAFENKLQTKRVDPQGKELVTDELARLVVESDYLLQQGQEHDRLATISTDLEIKPYSWMFIKQTGIYDPAPGYLESLDTDITTTDPKKNWLFDVGHRYERSGGSQITTELETRITPKWKARIFEVYELHGHDLGQQEISVTRDLHCWEVEVTYSVSDSHAIYVMFHLKAFPEMPLKLGTSFSAPRAGSSQVHSY